MADEGTGIAGGGEGVDQTGLRLTAGVDALGSDPELQRDARVGVPAVIGLRDELAGDCDTLPILRGPLLDPGETGGSQREDEQYR